MKQPSTFFLISLLSFGFVACRRGDDDASPFRAAPPWGSARLYDLRPHRSLSLEAPAGPRSLSPPMPLSPLARLSLTASSADDRRGERVASSAQAAEARYSWY